jgi:hypothetical protein
MFWALFSWISVYTPQELMPVANLLKEKVEEKCAHS